MGQFEKLFSLADKDGSGSLTREKLERLKMGRDDITKLFKTLDMDGHDEVNRKEFIECMLSASGPVMKKDMLGLCLTIRKEMEAHEALGEQVTNECRERVDSSKRRLQALASDVTRLTTLLDTRQALAMEVS